MKQALSRETRLLGVVLFISFAYAAAVIAVAASQDQLALLRVRKTNTVLVGIWVTAFAFTFIAYALDLLIRRRPGRPLLVMAQEFRASVLRPDWFVARAAVVLGFYGMLLFFGPFKVMIGHVQGFPLDAMLVEIDRALFLGHDPWRVTHKLIGTPGTFVLHFAYNMWFSMMWLSLIYLVLRPELIALRARYLTAFLLTWIVTGSLAAFFLASAGPCFYERAFGDPYFAPLMERLHVIDADLREWGLGIWGLGLQDMLWNAYANKTELFGGGISAMPSVHVAVSVLMACGAWQLNRRLGWAMIAFAVIIWIGSIHLAWHYAVDGLVALPLTLGIWWLSGQIADRLVLAERRRSAPVAALQAG